MTQTSFYAPVKRGQSHVDDCDVPQSRKSGKNAIVNVRMTDAQRKKLHEKAREQGLKLSDLLRRELQQFLPDNVFLPPVDRERVAQQDKRGD